MLNRLIHRFFMLFGLFLLFQALIVNNVGGATSSWGKTVKWVDEFVILLCFSLYLIDRLVHGHIYIKKVGILIFLFVFIGILSSFAAHVPVLIALSQLFLSLKGFMLFWVLANLKISKNVLRKYLRFFFAVALVIFILGIVDVFAPAALRSVIGNHSFIAYRFGIPSVKSVFDHPGIFGWFMTVASLYCFAFWLSFRQRRYLLPVLFFSLGVFLSMRRKAWGGLLVGLFSALWLRYPRKRLKYSLVYIGILFIMVISFFSQISTLVEYTAREYLENPMQVARIVSYVKSFEIATDYFPFGAGFGRYCSWMSRVHYSPVYDEYGLSSIWGMSRGKSNFITDTFWPMILGETGFLGFFIYVGIILYLFYHLYKIYKKSKMANERYIMAFSLGTMMIIIESLVESIAQGVYTAPPLAYFIFGSVGICYSLGTLMNPQPDRRKGQRVHLKATDTLE
jgi:hypothetical protein